MQCCAGWQMVQVTLGSYEDDNNSETLFKHFLGNISYLQGLFLIQYSDAKQKDVIEVFHRSLFRGQNNRNVVLWKIISLI